MGKIINCPVCHINVEIKGKNCPNCSSLIEKKYLAGIDIEKKYSRKKANIKELLACIFLFLLGAGVFYATIIHPKIKEVQAKDWKETPCIIISSGIETYHSKITAYKIKMSYAYKFNGLDYKSNDYEFSYFPSLGYDSKQKTIDGYPPGKKTICYVNPYNPGEAIINREYSPNLTMGIPSICLVILGLLGGYSSLTGTSGDIKFPVHFIGI